MRLLLLFLLISAAWSNDRGATLHFDSLFEQHVFESVLNDPASQSYITGVLVSEGILDTVTLGIFNSQLNTLQDNIGKKLDRDDDPEDQAEFIYDYLYKNIFKKFNESAFLKNIFQEKNCNQFVCSNLYYIICRHFGINVNIELNTFYSYNWMLADNDTLKIFFDSEAEGFNQELKFILDDQLGVLKEPILDIIRKENNYRGFPLVRQMSFNYNIRATGDLQKGAIKSALLKFEKAVKLNPANERYIENYENTLHALYGISRDYSEFIPYLKNSFFLLNREGYDVNAMLVMLNQVINYYANDLLHFNMALDFIFEARLVFQQEIIQVALDRAEKEIHLKKIYTHARRGSFRNAYFEAKDLYYSKEKLPVYKEILVELGLAFVNTGIRNRDFSKEIQNAVDTLYQEAPDYASVQETYIMVHLNPVLSDPDLIYKSPYKARKKVLPVYKQFPDNIMVRQVMASIYYNMSMAKVRENKLQEAFAILEEGLKYAPGNKMLLDAQDSILKQFE